MPIPYSNPPIKYKVRHQGNDYFNPANNYEVQHQDSEDLAINNTSLHRFLAPLSIHTTASSLIGMAPAYQFPSIKILKKGYSVHLTEAVAMNYVAQHTSIPVPKVYCSFLHKNRAYIIMERIRGKNLAAAWKHLPKESLQKIFSQLKVMVQELRALELPPNTGVGSCVGGSMYDSRVPHSIPRFGPFTTIQEFHRWLRDDLEATKIGGHVSEKEVDARKAMIVKQEGP